jgi:hypothetical protein
MSKVNTVPMPKLYISPTVSDGKKIKGSWDVHDESANIVEGPFTSNEEAKAYRDDICAGRVQLSGSERYKAFWTTEENGGLRGVTQAVVDAGKIAQKKREEHLAQWRKQNRPSVATK